MVFNTTANNFILDEKGAYDRGELDKDSIADFLQARIDDGSVWQMKRSYRQKALTLIQKGACLLGPRPFLAIDGNYIPSREEVGPGDPGSKEYFLDSLVYIE